MAPFRWPEMKHELALAKEVAKYFPEKPQEWDEVAKIISEAFSTDDKQVEVKGRGYREKMARLLEKYTKLQLLNTSLAIFDFTFGWFALTL